MKRIAIIGGGVTGVTTAYALLRRGHEVTLYEQQRYAAMDTSFANGGQLSASNAEVWNSWPTLWKGFKWMWHQDAPLLINPKPSWHKLSWLAEFAMAIGQYQRNTVDTVRLAIRARDILWAWAEQESINFDLEKRGILHIYRTRSEFEQAERVSALLAQGGLTRQAVTPEDIRVIEPNLKGDFYGGFFTGSDATGDIHKFTFGLAQAVERLGGHIRYGTRVHHLGADCHRAWVVGETFGAAPGHGQRDTFDRIVICAGVGSRKLAAQLGDRVNIYPVKGYSITVHLDDPDSQAAAPQVSLLDDATKIVSSRLGDGRLRVAGTAEFNGYNRDIRNNRILPLVKWVEACFPGVSTRHAEPWAGLRPMMPNMMPKVGPGQQPCVFYNTGHGHLGWTLSAATAEWVADQIEGRAISDIEISSQMVRPE